MKHARKCQDCGLHYSENDAVAVQTDPGYDRGHNDAEPPSYEPGCPSCESIHYDIDGEFCESCGEWMEKPFAIDGKFRICEPCYASTPDNEASYLTVCPTCRRIIDTTMMNTNGKTCLHCQFDAIHEQIKDINNTLRGAK